MTHAPGSIVPPRELEGINVDDSFAGKVLGKFGLKPGKKDPAAEGPGLTGRLARGAAEGTGRGAFDRAMQASRRSAARGGAPRPAPQAPPKPEWSDKTWAGQNIQAAGGTPRVVTAAPTEPAPPPAEPSFLASVPGALALPFRGLGVVLVHIIIVALALLLLELSPPLGVLASGVAFLQVVALRVRVVRESSAGRDKVGWPDIGALFSALVPYVAAGLWALPAAGLCVAAYAPHGALRADSPASLQQRVRRLVNPLPRPGEGEAEPPSVRFGQGTYLMLEALVGVVDREGLGAPRRPTEAVVRELSRSARARLTALVDGARASGVGIAARAAAAAAFLFFPMAFLCAVRLRSAYAAWHVPLVLRSVLRVLGPYLIVLFAFAAQLGLTAAALFFLPERLVALGPGGHFAWVGSVAAAFVALPLVTADLSGRLYRSRQLTLGWD